MSAENIVISSEISTDTSSYRFLADIQMNWTYYLWLGAKEFG